MNTEKTMHTLGRLCGLVWRSVTESDPIVTDAIAETPAKGFAMLAQTASFRAVADDPNVKRILATLPEKLPKGPLPVEDQGPFYMGIFQQGHKITLAESLGPEDLRKTGEALFGATWQSELARQLGINDSRRVRQWLAGERPIPAGIWLELAEIAKARGENLINLSNLLMRT